MFLSGTGQTLDLANSILQAARTVNTWEQNDWTDSNNVAVAKHIWLLVCCSSHGEVDVSDNLVLLMSALTKSELDFCDVALRRDCYGWTFALH
jgi:hypothetical protein